MHEIYLPPFAAAVAARVAAVMPAFIDIAGEPMTANAKLLQGWLRRVVGFDGVVISDYNAVAELINHGVAADLVEAAALALNAGVDIDMTSGAYIHGLPEALKRGLVTMAAIDASVRRVLELKERLGLFDDPYRRGSSAPRRGADGGTPRAGARGGATGDRAHVQPRASLAALPRNPAHRGRLALWLRRRARCWDHGLRRAAPRTLCPFWKGSKRLCRNAGSITPPAST